MVLTPRSLDNLEINVSFSQFSLQIIPTQPKPSAGVSWDEAAVLCC